MFCPECKSEYRKGFLTCGECDVPLVEALPPQEEPAFIEYEEVLSTNSPSDRVIIKSILDAEGITYFFQGENVAAYVYHAIPVRLMVRKDEVMTAIDILRDLDLSFTFGGHLIDQEDDEQ